MLPSLTRSRELWGLQTTKSRGISRPAGFGWVQETGVKVKYHKVRHSRPSQPTLGATVAQKKKKLTNNSPKKNARGSARGLAVQTPTSWQVARGLKRAHPDPTCQRRERGWWRSNVRYFSRPNWFVFPVDFPLPPTSFRGVKTGFFF